ncbi:unnamed protein product [Prunus brigantina]
MSLFGVMKSLRGGGGGCNSRVRYLKDFVENNSLVDTGFSRYKFTWICVNGGAVEIHERLDRAVMNVKWQEVYPNSMVTHCARVSRIGSLLHSHWFHALWSKA